MNVTLITLVAVGVAVAAVAAVAALCVMAYCGFIVGPATSRRLRVQLEEQWAETEIDRLTKQTIQQMRDAVRADFRDQSSEIIDGEIMGRSSESPSAS